MARKRLARTQPEGEYLDLCPYKVEELCAPNVEVDCECGWKGWTEHVLAIDGCSLTPGDPSPVGRCPKCDCLVYVEKQEG
jgi:hypothetical protein